MDASTYKLGIKEFIAIAIIIVGIALTDHTPSIVYQQTTTAGWMQPIISAIMLIIPLLLLLKVIRHFDTNDFCFMIKQILGKYIGTISLMGLCLLLTVRLILESAIYTNIIQTMFYPNTPKVVIYFILIAIAGYIAYKGIIHIGAVAWLLFFSIKLALLVSLILTAIHGSINFLLPFFGAGEMVVIKEGLYNVSIYFDLLLLCFILPHMKSKADFLKGTWIAFFYCHIRVDDCLYDISLLF